LYENNPFKNRYQHLINGAQMLFYRKSGPDNIPHSVIVLSIGTESDLTAPEDQPVPHTIDDECAGDQEEKPYENLDPQGKRAEYRITEKFKNYREQDPEEYRENNPGPVHTGDQVSVFPGKKEL
jgi:hypothetical protein